MRIVPIDRPIPQMRSHDPKRIGLNRAAQLPHSGLVIDARLMKDGPLLLAGEEHLWEPSRQGIILRWLAASLMLALMGGGLIGSSIYIALDGSTSAPEPA
ncbi:hypothetical protein P7L87_26210, partial [Vibrio parahaemolyticus]|nr:hypothetical protein [Vibrio parahaemolyticus]